MGTLSKCDANYAPLSPVTLLPRAAAVYSDRTSVIYGRRTRFTWNQTYDRCRRLASALRSLNVSKNDVVSVLAPNVPAVCEMHFAVPMAGAVLNTINIRLKTDNIAKILKHSEAKLFFVDYQLVRLASDALDKLAMDNPATFPLVVVIDDIEAPTGIRLGELEYEGLVASGDPSHEPHRLEDEWDPISLNYTSGTTADPKGVVYSHRGAYLSTMSLLLQWGVGFEPVYLWSLPMFHCNGWTFAWGVAARGGANVCIRSASAAEMYRAIADHGVTHMCGVPVILKSLLDAPPSERRQLPAPVNVLTGGSPPPATLLDEIERVGFRITHAYGLTEATGPALVCEWRADWDCLSPNERARLKARQGVSLLTLADADVKDPATMASVPRDGQSRGEITLRGSTIMKGYFKNGDATAEAFKGGWFWTGDVGVVHPDGYIEVKDRSKDVIKSGGENISSVEVEGVLHRHPAVSEAAVVAMPHPKWEETPCAFLKLKAGSGIGKLEEEDIIKYCKASLPGFMVPRRVVFVDELPKTATGKVQKAQLRELAARLMKPPRRGGSTQGGAAAPARPRFERNVSNKAPLNEEQVVAVSRL